MKEDKEKSIHMYISTLSKLNMIQLIERKILILKKKRTITQLKNINKA